jgi:hypothetical protein
MRRHGRQEIEMRQQSQRPGIRRQVAPVAACALALALVGRAVPAWGGSEVCAENACAQEFAELCNQAPCRKRSRCVKDLIRDCAAGRATCPAGCATGPGSTRVLRASVRKVAPRCPRQRRRRKASTFARIQRRMFDRRCASAGCHASGAAAGGLALEEGRSYDALVWARSTGTPDKFRVAPADVTDSALMTVLEGALDGTDVHASVAKVGPTDVELVRSWIAAGAPPTGIVPGDRGGPAPVDFARTMPPPPAPAPGKGIQLHFGPIEVPAGGEREICRYEELPAVAVTTCSASGTACQTADDCPAGEQCVFYIRGARSFTAWPPHHFFLSTYDGTDGAQAFPQKEVDDSPFCVNFGPPGVIFRGTDIVRGQTTVERIGYGPPGVAKQLRAHQPLLLDAHFVNPLDVPLSVDVWVNIEFADAAEVTHPYTGGRLSIDSSLDVPPCDTHTDCATWSPTVPVNMFLFFTHSDKAVASSIDFCKRAVGTRCLEVGDRLYESDEALDPKIMHLDQPLHLEPGQGLQHCCTHVNDPPRMGCTGTQQAKDVPGIAELCRSDADCAGLPGATGKCEPQPLKFGFRSNDDACLLLGYYFGD